MVPTSNQGISDIAKIGLVGQRINDAVFVPAVHTSINELVGDIEKFLHDEIHYFPELLKIALVHYQFKTIHPFQDGNGRVGRLLITLYQRPMIDAAKTGEVVGISPALAYKLIADMEQFGILKEITGGKRGKMYVYYDYLQLFK